jgi:hypothetical protein
LIARAASLQARYSSRSSSIRRSARRKVLGAKPDRRSASRAEFVRVYAE